MTTLETPEERSDERIDSMVDELEQMIWRDQHGRPVTIFGLREKIKKERDTYHTECHGFYEADE